MQIKNSTIQIERKSKMKQKLENSWCLSSVVSELLILKFNQINLNQFRPSVAFYTETMHSISSGNQMTSFYMKFNAGLKWVNSHEKERVT